MSLDKLKKLEQAVLLFKGKYDALEAERDRLIDELKGANSSLESLTREKEEIKLKVDSLLDLFKGLGL